MRLDKYLKNARIIKRRSVANTACSTGHVMINDKVAKPGSEVKPGDTHPRPLYTSSRPYITEQHV